MQSPRCVLSALKGKGGACRRAAPAQDLRARLLEAGELTGTTSRDVWKPYWAAQQRFFKLLCISMKARRGGCRRRPGLPAWSPPATCSTSAARCPAMPVWSMLATVPRAGSTCGNLTVVGVASLTVLDVSLLYVLTQQALVFLDGLVLHGAWALGAHQE